MKYLKYHLLEEGIYDENTYQKQGTLDSTFPP
jgi:hypothetical protein